MIGSASNRLCHGLLAVGSNSSSLLESKCVWTNLKSVVFLVENCGYIVYAISIVEVASWIIILWPYSSTYTCTGTRVPFSGSMLLYAIQAIPVHATGTGIEYLLFILQYGHSMLACYSSIDRYSIPASLVPVLNSIHTYEYGMLYSSTLRTRVPHVYVHVYSSTGSILHTIVLLQ